MNVLVPVALVELSSGGKAVLALAGLVALFIALKVGRLMVKMFLVLVGLALLGGAAWWFLMR